MAEERSFGSSGHRAAFRIASSLVSPYDYTEMLQMSSELIIHFGHDSQARNRSAFQQYLESTDPGRRNFLWIVTTDVRKKQLQELVFRYWPGFFDSPVMTFSGMLGALRARYISDRILIGETERRALLSRILAGKDFSGLPGIRRELPLRLYLSQYVAYVKSLHIEDEEMLRLRYARFRRNLRPLESVLIQVFAEYQKMLETQGLEDWEGALNSLYAGFLTGRMILGSVFPGTDSLFFEDLSPRTPVEKGLLRLICHEIPSVQVSIHTGEMADTDILARELDFLAPLETVKWVYHPPHHPSPGKRLIRAADRKSEVLTIADRILEVRRETPQLKFSEIAVACRTDHYSTYILEEFPRRGIPVYFAEGLDSGKLVSEGILSKLLEILEKDLEVVAVFDLIELVDSSGRCFPRALAASVERSIRKGGLTSGSEAWEKVLSELAIREEKPADREAVAHRIHALERLREWVRRLDIDTTLPKPLIEWHDLFFQSARHFLEPDGGPAPASGDAEGRFLSDLLDGLRKEILIRQDEPCGFGEFAFLLRETISRTRVEHGSMDNSVVIGSPEELQQCEFKHLFWAGLVDGEFPARTSQHLFFEDTHQAHWGRPSWQERFQAGGRLFDRMSSAATDQLTLLLPRRINEMPALPSPYLEGTSISEPVGVPSSSANAYLSSPGSASNIRRGRRVLAIRESDPDSQFDGFLRSARQQFREDFFRNGIRLSPHHLEEYHRCGYRYFLNRIIGIEAPIDEQDEEARHLGVLVHGVLHRFVSEADLSELRREMPEKADWMSAQKSRMAAILERELELLSRADGTPRDLFWQDRIDKLSRGLSEDKEEGGILTEFLDQTWESLEDFEILSSETPKGPARLGLLRFRGDPGKTREVPVLLRGKVDRIDQAVDVSRIIDYKTGPGPVSRARSGWGFQLPLYAFLIRKDSPTRSVEALHYVIQLPRHVRQVPLQARTDSNSRTVHPFIHYYRRKALQMASLLYRGRFPFTVLSRGKAGCSTCPFRAACRYDPVKSARILNRKLFPGEERLVAHGKWIGPSVPETSPAGSGVPGSRRR